MLNDAQYVKIENKVQKPKRTSKMVSLVTSRNIYWQIHCSEEDKDKTFSDDLNGTFLIKLLAQFVKWKKIGKI